MAKLKFLVVFLGILVLTAGCAGLGRRASTMKMLFHLGRNDATKEKAQRQETENYRKVKEYIDSGKIEEGIPAKTALKLFGEAVLVFSESYGEKWAYKSSAADWIGGEKIYLFFDKQGLLTKWECVNCS